jgi:hypothetical protein
MNAVVADNGIEANGTIVHSSSVQTLMGGGMFFSDCSSTIVSDSCIMNNWLSASAVVTFSDLIRGGGLCWDNNRANSSIMLMNSSVSGNRNAIGGSDNHGNIIGGGVYLNGGTNTDIGLTNVVAANNSNAVSGPSNFGAVRTKLSEE